MKIVSAKSIFLFSGKRMYRVKKCCKNKYIEYKKSKIKLDMNNDTAMTTCGRLGLIRTLFNYFSTCA